MSISDQVMLGIFLGMMILGFGMAGGIVTGLFLNRLDQRRKHRETVNWRESAKSTERRCPVHGCTYPHLFATRCRTETVLDDVAAERHRQFAKYGNNEDNRLGINGESWLAMYTHDSAHEIEQAARREYEDWEARGLTVTRAMLAREEFCEFMAAPTKENMREEAIQVAAIMVALVESLDSGVYDDEFTK